MKFFEMSKLWLRLADLDVVMSVRNIKGGYQICGDSWSAVCYKHEGGCSDGYEKGLIEVREGGFCSGRLTADEAFELIEVVEGL